MLPPSSSPSPLPLSLSPPLSPLPLPPPPSFPSQLIHINSEWDKEYKEQEEAFRRYRYDSQQAQTENHSFIQRLKEKSATLEEEVSTLKHELQKSQKEIYTLQKRIASMGSVQSSKGRGHSQLEEENTLLRQQVSL